MRHFRTWSLALLLAAAFGLPFVLRSERGGTSGERAFVAHAVIASGQLLSHPVESLLIRRYVVRKLGEVPPRPSNGDCEPALRPYQAQVTAVTLFGLPMAEVTVTCDWAGRAGVEES
ncbi:hypothetical protein F8S09_15710 [Deinococcus sp. SDU3-2]|uniref:Uncharacterized protein n=1 Tax=Deinococcus terrestris TaxID=2651870 RepID=A0A7X1NYK5_9DEIO|nr:hypothetical protein [Deinococcus terrestris]MPY68103.1 hypothetical protein [Deinococcus terrestris]